MDKQEVIFCLDRRVESRDYSDMAMVIGRRLHLVRETVNRPAKVCLSYRIEITKQ